MPSREEVLRDETFKGQCDSDAARVFQMIHHVKGLELHRTSLLLARLIERMLKTGQLSPDELDELLLLCR